MEFENPLKIRAFAEPRTYIGQFFLPVLQTNEFPRFTEKCIKCTYKTVGRWSQRPAADAVGID